MIGHNEIRVARSLTEFEVQSLQAFAAANGRSWKSKLIDTYWYNARIWSGPVAGMGSALHGIRNEFGPMWLGRYKLPRSTV
jgi:hypothetical protein